MNAPGDGGDGLRAEQLAQRADLDLEVVLLDHHARPDDVEQLVLGHEALAPLDQRAEHVERPLAERHRAAVGHQQALVRLQLEAAKAVDALQVGGAEAAREAAMAANVPGGERFSTGFRTFKGG